MGYSINIEMVYTELPFIERIEKVKEAGFDGIEFWRWDNKDVAQIRQVCEENDVRVTAFCATGDDSLCDREHAEDALSWVSKSIAVAKELKCDTLIMFPNHFTPNGAADFRGRYSITDMQACITRNLTLLAPELERAGVTLLLEPLNNLGDDGGMSVTTTAEGASIIRAVNSPNVRLLCDFFHMQVMHGNLTTDVLNNLDIVPYVHLADVPDRCEPGTGEINYEYILRSMKSAGFDGTVCFECFTKGTAQEGLAHMKELCERID